MQAGVPASALLPLKEGKVEAASSRGRDPVETDTVVLRGLKRKPELNGRFGQVLAVVSPDNVDSRR